MFPLMMILNLWSCSSLRSHYFIQEIIHLHVPKQAVCGANSFSARLNNALPLSLLWTETFPRLVSHRFSRVGADNRRSFFAPSSFSCAKVIYHFSIIRADKNHSSLFYSISRQLWYENISSSLTNSGPVWSLLRSSSSLYSWEAVKAPGDHLQAPPPSSHFRGCRAAELHGNSDSGNYVAT